MPKNVKNDSSVKSVSVKKNEEKQPMSKRKKIILCVSLCVVIILIVCAVLLAVFLGDETPDGPTYALGVKYKGYYTYAVNSSKTQYQIEPSFCGNIPYENFTITQKLGTESIELTRDFIVKTSGAEEGDEATFEVAYNKGNVVIAEVKIVVKKVDGYVTDADSFFAMSANGVYVLSNDLDFSGEARRYPTFSGEFYGNGYKITALDIGKGGLFGELRGAVVEGLTVSGVTGGAVAKSACNVGVIANRAEVSVIENCLTSGAFTVKSELVSDAQLYAGGIVGYMTSSVKSVASGRICKGLVSETNITVSGGGDIKVGGIAGGVKNVTVRESRSFSEITVNVSSEEIADFGALYVGGIVGADTAEYRETVGVYDIDETAKLYSSAVIDVNIVGGNDFDYCYIGGLFGRLENRGVANSSFDGDIDVNITRVNVSVGGVAGGTENTTGYRMAVRGFTSDGDIKIYSLGTVNVGGLIGVGSRTEYEKCEVKNEPVIETDASKVQGIQTKNNAIGVSK